MMVSSLVCTLACSVFFIGNTYGIDLSSSSITEDQVKAAYMISNSKALSEYNSLTTTAAQSSTLQCANGPNYRNYYKSGYLYWPPIRFRRCDELVCGQSTAGKCIPSNTRVIYRWVIVFRCTHHYCHFVGIQFLQFTEHLSCNCPQCITDADCTSPETCNSRTSTCQCPTSGSCPLGSIWDHLQCKCVPCPVQACPVGFAFHHTLCECFRTDNPFLDH